MLLRFLTLVLDEAAQFQKLKSTQQGLPYHKGSIMNPNSKSGSQKKGWKKPETSQWDSTARNDPCEGDSLDYLHINLVYCGGIYM